MTSLSEIKQFTLQTVSLTALASVCAYGGTFFFTNHLASIGAKYLATVAIVSQVVYKILDDLKIKVNDLYLKNFITCIQLLHLPVSFYLLNGIGCPFLSGAKKLEIIAATAYFVAIPVFFHLSIIAWNEPTVSHISAAMGVLLPLAHGLKNYAELFH